MKILITGGAGYIGSVACTLLRERGHQVRAFDNLLFGGESLLTPLALGGVELVRGDVRDEEAIFRAAEGAEAIVHLAAIVGDPASKRDPESTRTTNLDGSRNVVRAAQRAGARKLLFFSTCSNYGASGTDDLLDETAPLHPLSLYAETKCEAERFVLAAADERLCVTGARLATVYGLSPRMRFDLTVNDFAREAVLRGRLVVYGEQFWRPYVHTADVARAISSMLESPPERIQAQVFNVGATDENYRKHEIVRSLKERIPELDVTNVPQPDDPRNYRVSFERVRRVLGFEPSRTVPDGLDELIAALRSGVFASPDDPRYTNTP